MKGLTLQEELSLPPSLPVWVLTWLFDNIYPYLKDIFETVGEASADSIISMVTQEVTAIPNTVAAKLENTRTSEVGSRGPVFDTARHLRSLSSILRPLEMAPYTTNLLRRFVDMVRAGIAMATIMSTGELVRQFGALAITNVGGFEQLSPTIYAALTAGSYVGAGTSVYLNEFGAMYGLNPFFGACIGAGLSAGALQLTSSVVDASMFSLVAGMVVGPYVDYLLHRQSYDSMPPNSLLGKLAGCSGMKMGVGLASITPVIGGLSYVGVPDRVLGLAIGAAALRATNYDGLKTLFYQVPAGLLRKVANDIWSMVCPPDGEIDEFLAGSMAF